MAITKRDISSIREAIKGVHEFIFPESKKRKLSDLCKFLKIFYYR
jgi:hypothetical protein